MNSLEGPSIPEKETPTRTFEEALFEDAVETSVEVAELYLGNFDLPIEGFSNMFNEVVAVNFSTDEVGIFSEPAATEFPYTRTSIMSARNLRRDSSKLVAHKPGTASWYAQVYELTQDLYNTLRSHPKENKQSPQGVVSQTAILSQVRSLLDGELSDDIEKVRAADYLVGTLVLEYYRKLAATTRSS